MQEEFHPNEATRFATDDKLQKQLFKEMDRRIKTVRKHGGDDAVSVDEAKELLVTAIYLGYFRVQAIRFSLHTGNGEDWWRERRSEETGDGRSLHMDHMIAVKHFGDALFHYTGKDPITEEEVLTAAKVEYRALIASKGTDYYKYAEQDRAVRQQQEELKGRSAVAFNVRNNRRRAYGTLDRAEVATTYKGKRVSGNFCYPYHSRHSREDAQQDPIVDTTAQTHIEDFEYTKYNEEDGHVLGEGASLIYIKVAELTNPRFALAWLFWHLKFKQGKHYEELMRTFGDTEETCGGRKEFLTKARMLKRKLEKANEQIIPLLREDPELREVSELIQGV